MTIQQMQKMIDNNNKSIEMFVKKSQRKPGTFYGFGKAKEFKIKEVEKNDAQ